MDDDSLNRVLSQVVEQGDEYGQLATFVSERILTIEGRLNQSSGKIPFSFLEENIAIRYDKVGSNWRLLVIDPCDAKSLGELDVHWTEGWRPLASSAAVTKARALVIVPHMLTHLANLQQKYIEELRRTVGDVKLPGKGGP